LMTDFSKCQNFRASRNRTVVIFFQSGLLFIEDNLKMTVAERYDASC
jgi:hypothetical protein